jgi:Spy/CpxP family protein refolding chaperone
MKNIKPLVIIATLLMVANCVLLGVLWYRNNNKKHPPQPQGQAFEYLTRELKLTPNQVNQYQALRDKHVQFTRKTGEEMRLQRDSFFDNLKNPNANPAAVRLLENRILANQGKLDSATFFHFRDFRKILNAEQAAKFDGIINTVLHMMSRPPGGPGARPGQNGPPPQGMEPGGKPMNNPQGRYDGRPGRIRPDDRPMGPPPGRTDSNGRPMGPPPPPGRIGPDGRPMGPRRTEWDRIDGQWALHRAKGRRRAIIKKFFSRLPKDYRTISI